MATAYEQYAAVLYAIEKISQGYTPTKAVDEANIPWATFKKYTTEDPTLAAMLDEADQRGADAMADALLTLGHKNNPYSCTDPKEQKVISDNIKWLLSRRHNRKYGEKVEVKVEATVQHVIVEQLEAARQRSYAAITEQRLPVLDADYVLLPPPPPVPER